VDFYEPGSGFQTQLHDLNPSDFQPTGLFWTTRIDEKGVDVNLGAGYASVIQQNIAIHDYGTIDNNLGGPLPGFPTKPPAGFVSFKLIWSGVQQRLNIKNTDPVYGGYGGEFVRNSAQMEGTAITDDYTFQFGPLAATSSMFATIGHERNGEFF